MHADVLRQAIPAAAAMLRSRFGVTRVLLFGSLVTGDVHAESDIDLAVEGLAPERYFEALGELFRTLPANVDLVRLEEASSSLGDRIAAEGRLV